MLWKISRALPLEKIDCNSSASMTSEVEVGGSINDIDVGLVMLNRDFVESVLGYNGLEGMRKWSSFIDNHDRDKKRNNDTGDLNAASISPTWSDVPVFSRLSRVIGTRASQRSEGQSEPADTLIRRRHIGDTVPVDPGAYYFGHHSANRSENSGRACSEQLSKQSVRLKFILLCTRSLAPYLMSRSGNAIPNPNRFRVRAYIKALTASHLLMD